MFAENIKNARRRLGLTQKGLAEKMGISRASLSSWEIARANPDLETFIRLCHVLDMGPTIFWAWYARKITRP